MVKLTKEELVVKEFLELLLEYVRKGECIVCKQIKKNNPKKLSKFERCVLYVKKTKWCKENKCNPYAVCRAKIKSSR